MPVLHRPLAIEEACELMAELDEPMVYGGGTAIQILLKQDVLFATDFVDLSLVEGLAAVVESDGAVRLGPMVSLRTIERSPRLRDAVPLLALAYSDVANPRVRNTASVGGNLAHGDYRLDAPPALLVLEAVVEATSVRGTRRIPIGEFFVGFQQTALERDEIVTAIEVPYAPPDSVGHFVKLSSLAANDWPCATAAALVTRDGGRRLRLGIGALAPTPLRVDLDLSGLDDDGVRAAATEAASEVLDPLPDVRGGVEFKRRLGMVAVEEAVTTALRGGGHG